METEISAARWAVWLGKDFTFSFYRATLHLAWYCHDKLSVCPSATLVDCDHTRWNSSKIILRLISLTFLLPADPNIMDLLQREQPQILAGNVAQRL